MTKTFTLLRAATEQEKQLPLLQFCPRYFKGTVSASTESFPFLSLQFNQTKKSANSSTACSGPVNISGINYDNLAVSGAGFAWPTDPLLDVLMTDNCESLSLGSMPSSIYEPTGNQGIQIQVIKIIETSTIKISGITLANGNTLTGANLLQNSCNQIQVNFSNELNIPLSNLEFEWRFSTSNNCSSPLAGPITTATKITFLKAPPKGERFFRGLVEVRIKDKVNKIYDRLV